MENLVIEFVAELAEDTTAKMKAGLVQYETKHGVDVNYAQFGLVLHDDSGEVLGVLNGYTAFAEIYIDDLWVDANHRGCGHGSQLIMSLEQKFKGQGFNNINLVTSEFQAPGFYRKAGFEEEFTRVNRQHPNLSKTFFVKFLGEENQTQGIK